MREENNALNEQMEALYKEVIQVAKMMANTHATEKAIDQKAIVIGRALVSQKETAKQIQANQEEQSQLLVECDNRERDRQRKILEAIEEVAQSLANLEDTETKKQILTDSLERLSEEQQSFMEENRAFSRKASEDLEEVKNQLMNMKQTAEKMELSDQVRYINGKAEEMKQILASYADKRNKITALMAKQTQETRAQIGEIAQLMETQRKRVDKIVAVSTEYGDKTIKMCEILEALLEEVRTVKAEEESPSLEDLFGEQPKEEPIDFDEAMLSPEDAEDTEELDQHEEIEELENETEREPEPIFHDVEDDDLRFVGEDGGKEIRKKKKGLFSRLFGGK